ncbi:MAG: GTPase [Cyanobacteria bacterium P01_D01_bin.73]
MNMSPKKLTRSQVAVLVGPWGAIAVFLLLAAAIQIHVWGLNWIWAIFVVVGVGWRWLVVRWLRERTGTAERAIAELANEADAAKAAALADGSERAIAAQKILDQCLADAATDAPIWEDWEQFWQRCQSLVRETARVYNPDVKYPLLSIYVPQAYGLIRGTVDDLDQWMEQLSPVLGRVTIAEAYGAYELYQKWEPSARKVMKVWGWARWVLNPAVAATRLATQESGDRANQELISNLGQLLREAALRNLSARAVTLYCGEGAAAGTLARVPSARSGSKILPPKTATLREIFSQATSADSVDQQPVNIVLVGRTGAGKSSLINTLFSDRLAQTDVLPNTDKFTAYQWTLDTGEQLQLWDSPGYEQGDGAVDRDRLVEVTQAADLVLVVAPALDPAPMMDRDFLQAVKLADGENDGDASSAVPVVAVVTQVDRVRPKREWQPPYDWQRGDRPKEINIREAVAYRREVFGDSVSRVLPVVTWDGDRLSWGADPLAAALLEQLAPAKQQRLARFLQSLEARSIAAARLIDRYIFQMSTTQGVTTFLKSPALQFISTTTTGQPGLAYLLAEKIPIEQLPIVLGKLQMAYDLFNLLGTPDFTQVADLTDAPASVNSFNLLELWPLLLRPADDIGKDTQAFGKALVEYWTQGLSAEELGDRYRYHLEQTEASN